MVHVRVIRAKVKSEKIVIKRTVLMTIAIETISGTAKPSRKENSICHHHFIVVENTADSQQKGSRKLITKISIS